MLKSCAGGCRRDRIALPEYLFPAIRASIDSVEIAIQHNGGNFQQKYSYNLKRATINGIRTGMATVAVKAYDAAKNMIMSGQSQITVMGGQTNNANVTVMPKDPDNPYLLFPTKSGSMIALSWVMWSNPPYASFKHFTIQRQLAGGTWQMMATLTDPAGRSYTDNNTNSGAYLYRVAFVKQDNIEIASNIQTVILSGTIPSSLIPVLNTPTIIGTGISLAWAFPPAEESRISGFIIQRTTDNGATWTQIGNVPAQSRTYTDANPIAAATNGYQLTCSAAGTPYVSDRKDIFYAGSGGGVLNWRYYQGGLPRITTALTASAGNVWLLQTAGDTGSGQSRAIPQGTGKDTTVTLPEGTMNIVIFTFETKKWVYIAFDATTSTPLLCRGQPVAMEFKVNTNAALVPYTGTLDAARAALRTSSAEVWVFDATGATGMQEWVDSLSVSEITIQRKNVDVKVMTARDNFNFKGNPPAIPARVYLFFGQPGNPNQLLTVTNQGKIRPAGMWVANFIALP
jgi:hypothetical protein